MVNFSLRFWPLYLTRKFNIQRQISAAPCTQDPDVALSISTLITSVVPDPPSQTQAHTDIRWYTVKERMKPGSERTIKLRVLWGRISDGADATVFAAFGTRINSSVRVRELQVEDGKEPQALYEEKMTIDVRCLPLCINFG
jgi:hypothetical protein